MTASVYPSGGNLEKPLHAWPSWPANIERVRTRAWTRISPRSPTWATRIIQNRPASTGAGNSKKKQTRPDAGWSSVIGDDIKFQCRSTLLGTGHCPALFGAAWERPAAGELKIYNWSD